MRNVAKTDYNITNVCQERGIRAIDAHWILYDSLMDDMTIRIYAPESYSIYCY